MLILILTLKQKKKKSIRASLMTAQGCYLKNKIYHDFIYPN